MKKVIKLTESDIHRIVKNSVNKILKENQHKLNESCSSEKAYELEEKWNLLLSKNSPKKILSDLYGFLLEYKTETLEQFIDEASNSYRV